MLFRYQERMKISYKEAATTPWQEIQRAFYIWSLDYDRDKLETERHKRG
jgi:hypothetical protein